MDAPIGESGEKTIAEASIQKPVRLFSAWFCPFAQRAWIALEEKQVPYEYVPIVPYRSDPSKPGGLSKDPLTLQEKRHRYPDFINCSPNGLVPAIEYTTHSGKIDRVYESIVCIEYIDEAFSGPPLSPADDLAKKALMRVWMAHANERIIPHFYRMLMNPEDAERESERQKLLDGLKTFAGGMSPIGINGGAFFFGDSFTLVDIALCPWWQRFHSIGKTYRNLAIPSSGIFERLHKWGAACNSRLSVARTTVDQNRLIANYSSYADGSATSTVARTLAKL